VYTLFYAVLTVGSFATIAAVSASRSGDTSLASFAGLGAARPALALGFTVLMFAQAGVPFTTGFVAKFGVIRAAVDEQSYAIAIIAMVASVIAAAAYLRAMVTVWLRDDEAAPVRVPIGIAVVVGASALFTVVVGIVPGWLLDITESVSSIAR